MSEKDCQRGRIPARSIALGLIAVLAAACTETVTQIKPEDIVQIRLSDDSAQVATGRTLQIHAFPIDATGGFLVGQDVTWSSRNASVASVDESGVVTGVALGTTTVLASIAGFTDSTVVTVVLPPILVLSDDSVGFSVTAGGSDPAPDTVDVTNGGTAALVGVAVDSVVYGSGATGWLAATLDQTEAPAELALQPMTGAITTTGMYAATVWISATDADQSPATLQVTLDVAAGPAATMTLSDGDAQSADAGTAVATAPSVLVEDQFGNAAQGLAVTFSVTGGGGSVAAGTATVDASGIARVGSWTLGTTAGANELTATLGALTPIVFSATGVPGPATKLVISLGDNQSAVAGSAVTVSPAVKVSDDYDNGISGVAVTFGVVSGGGSVTGASQTTDASGVATVGSWTLGTVAGPNQLGATATGFASPLTFNATGLSGAATGIQYVAGDAQTDTVAATLPVDYSVKVVDTNGNGVEGIQVSWAVHGGGSVTSPTTTDATGVATTTRVLPTTPGATADTAAVGGLGFVPFSATATVGSPDEIRVTAGTGQSATVNNAVATAPQVIVEDKFNNPVSGHSVTFSVTGGGGSVSPTGGVVTDANGHATLASWTLGTASGTNNNMISALAAGSGITGNPVSISATATADAPDTLRIVSGDGQTAITGTNVLNAPTVVVVDQFGNDVAGRTVTFATSGGSVGSTSVVTGATGQAQTTWAPDVSGGAMQSDGTFPNTLDVAVQGTALATQLAASAIYSYGTHVNPLWSDCTGCHAGAGVSGLALDGTAATNHTSLVDHLLTCDASLNTSGYRRVSPAGGTSAVTLSVLLHNVDPTTTEVGACTPHGKWTTPSNPDALTIVRAWIRNGAPNN